MSTKQKKRKEHCPFFCLEQKEKAMSQCIWCGAYKNGHDDGCPSAFPAHSPEKNSYHAGWRDGRAGKTEPTLQESKFYMCGFGLGIVALEEAQNGFDPRFA
ncbi:hypothetical protein HY416_01735 [Candidatus Kaiserbacteria bacterium]|nr:hypothetical protein [Candidatus Kaiserbacteria bacterium]